MLFFLISFSLSALQDIKDLKKEIKKKAIREARKEAKKLKKEVYAVSVALPMEKQLETTWMKQYEQDENGYPLNIVSTRNSVAETQSAAKIQAGNAGQTDCPDCFHCYSDNHSC